MPIPHSRSKPTAGLTRQAIGVPRCGPPRQPTLQLMHSRSSSRRPSRALATHSGSAISGRTRHTASAVPSASSASQVSGVISRATANTGTPWATSRIARALCTNGARGKDMSGIFVSIDT